MTYYLGIDPGLGGAIALLDSDAKAIWVEDMPTLRTTKTRRVIDQAALLDLLDPLRSRSLYGGDVRVVIETAIVLPGQGASSGLKIGIGYGQILGQLAALRLPFWPVAAQRWQGGILGKCEKGTAKDVSRAFASRTWPDVQLGERKSQDRADALCIALYGVRNWAGGVS